MDPNREVNLPERIVAELDRCSDEQLKQVVRYAQRRLERRHDPSTEIEPRHENEEIVSIEEKDGYTLVVVEEEDGFDERISYHVRYEPDPDGEGGRYHWRYLGPVDT